MTKKSSIGCGPTVLVAIEQQFPDSIRIIDDDLAYRIMPWSIKVAIRLERLLWPRDRMIQWVEKRMPGIWSAITCRKRYIDDKIAEAPGSAAEIVVNLGAGFDTRAYRLPALAKAPVFEVDLREIIDAKRSQVGKVFGEIPASVTLVPIDFDRGDLGAVLASHGYAADKKTFFIWEAVTQYLTEAGVRTTFDFLAQAPAGSRLVFTYVRKDFVEGKVFYNNEYTYRKMVLKDKLWHFGMDPEDVADFLGGYGWRVLEHVGYDELTERYVKPTGRKLAPMLLERMVYAEKL